jgi:hypothetical protein
MLARRMSAILSVLAALALCPGADAAGQPIAAVEVSSQVSREGRDLRALVRGKVESQLRNVRWGDARSGGPFVLSTSLVRLDTSTQDGAVTVACTVSMTLRDQKRGVLRAIVQGRAQAEDRADAARMAEEDAVRVAVRSAVSGLPEAIRRSR